MKVRTLTLGMPGSPRPEAIAEAGRLLEPMVAGLRAAGWIVQTRRVAFTSPKGVDLDPSELEDACEVSGVDFCNLGAVADPNALPGLARFLLGSQRLCLSIVGAAPGGGLREDAIRAAATMMQLLARETDQGLGNFQFGIDFCVRPGAPFFPISHHDPNRPPAVSIGTENSGVLVEALAEGAAGASTRLRDLLSTKFGVLERDCQMLARDAGCEYGGIDPSIAPSLDPDESIARAFASAGVSLGGPGTVALCGMITAVLRQLPLAARPGFAGLMLPVLEDPGLALAVDEGRLGLAGLLACASVCGVGLDTVPVAGDTPLPVLEAVLRDLGTVAVKQDKPLAGRLLLAPGKGPGERTSFDSPHLCNAAVLRL